MTKHQLFSSRRALAGLSALALASASLLGMSAASAETTLGDINFDETGSITVHKHKHQNESEPVEANPDGSESIATEGLNGVTFTVKKLEFDLTDPTVWDDLADLDPAGLTCGGSGGVVTGTVDGVDGVAEFSSLELGVYLVCETDAPDEVIDRADPFIVTVPYPNQFAGDSAGTWLYDVHVYPKNSTGDNPVKSVGAPSGLELGSTVDFPVEITIPTVGTAGFTGFTVSDDLDARLTPVGDGVESVMVGGSEVDTGNYDVTTSGNEVTVTFTDPEGLNFLATKQGATLTVTFQATVTGVGTIDNTAIVNVNGKDFTSNEVFTSWGDIEITKQDSDNELPLNGAVFEIYPAATPYPTAGAECANVIEAGASALSFGDPGETTFTTSVDGTVVIPGVFVSDSNTIPSSTVRCYVLVETVAPAGYVLPDNPNTAVKVSASATTEVGITLGAEVTINNTKQDVPQLPLTGAQGQLLMVFGGAAVLLTGAGLMVASRRKSASKSE
ncbi:SpaH/EbpB family LPXTG-anchored major pilin [Jonesiaceae bacterium BS-20]|uniref:SpaH/EbpB family LPXTG-anchored major pilin n=1 Tax=Jonesiaceae bacterium BS-20 TaxID=3120821 RepID=A0AAU7DXP1_9MICO